MSDENLNVNVNVNTVLQNQQLLQQFTQNLNNLANVAKTLTTNLQQGMHQTAQATQQQQQRTTQSLGALGTAVTGLGSAVKAFGAGFAGAFSAQAIEEFVRKSFVAFSEEERALNRVMISTGATDKQIRELGKTFQELEKITGISVEQQTASFINFVAATGLPTEQAKQQFESIAKVAFASGNSINDVMNIVIGSMRGTTLQGKELEKQLIGMMKVLPGGAAAQFAQAEAQHISKMREMNALSDRDQADRAAMLSVVNDQLKDDSKSVQALEGIYSKIAEPSSDADRRLRAFFFEGQKQGKGFGDAIAYALQQHTKFSGLLSSDETERASARRSLGITLEQADAIREITNLEKVHQRVAIEKSANAELAARLALLNDLLGKMNAFGTTVKNIGVELIALAKNFGAFGIIENTIRDMAKLLDILRTANQYLEANAKIAEAEEKIRASGRSLTAKTPEEQAELAEQHRLRSEAGQHMLGIGQEMVGGVLGISRPPEGTLPPGVLGAGPPMFDYKQQLEQQKQLEQNKQNQKSTDDLTNEIQNLHKMLFQGDGQRGADFRNAAFTPGFGERNWSPTAGAEVIALAEGGIVSGPTRALIGEAGPEGVFPPGVMTTGPMVADLGTRGTQAVVPVGDWQAPAGKSPPSMLQGDGEADVTTYQASSTAQFDLHDLARRNEQVLRPGIKRARPSFTDVLRQNPQLGIPEGQPGGRSGSTLFGGSQAEYLRLLEAQMQQRNRTTPDAEIRPPEPFNISATGGLSGGGGASGTIPNTGLGTIGPGETATGHASFYSSIPGDRNWPVDTGDMYTSGPRKGQPLPGYGGYPLERPGIALRSRQTAGPAEGQQGRIFKVTDPTGKTLHLPQVDLGPGTRTPALRSRVTDINAAAAKQFGYTHENFPTDQGDWSVHGLTAAEQHNYDVLRPGRHSQRPRTVSAEFGGPPADAVGEARRQHAELKRELESETIRPQVEPVVERNKRQFRSNFARAKARRTREDQLGDARRSHTAAGFR